MAAHFRVRACTLPESPKLETTRSLNLKQIRYSYPHSLQIFLTDLHIFSYSISWENLLKDQAIMVFVLLILVTFSLDYVLIL